MATGLDPNLVVDSDELLMSQVVSQEAIIRLLIEKGFDERRVFGDGQRCQS